MHVFDAQAGVPSVAVVRDDQSWRNRLHSRLPVCVDQAVELSQLCLVLVTIAHHNLGLRITGAGTAALNASIHGVGRAAGVAKASHLLGPLYHALSGSHAPDNRARKLHDLARGRLLELDLPLLLPALQLPDAADADNETVIIGHDRVHLHHDAIQGHLRAIDNDLRAHAVHPVALQGLHSDRRRRYRLGRSRRNLRLRLLHDRCWGRLQGRRLLSRFLRVVVACDVQNRWSLCG
mmetsp:Transcript_41700/g.107979  ORF Transcript_41700/g.107979 Transcript_41700/m.107979 type:complete len:235 (+) Transcript_41700:841-1545(+)